MEEDIVKDLKTLIITLLLHVAARSVDTAATQ
jgi:hypothetical protein